MAHDLRGFLPDPHEIEELLISPDTSARTLQNHSDSGDVCILDQLHGLTNSFNNISPMPDSVTSSGMSSIHSLSYASIPLLHRSM